MAPTTRNMIQSTYNDDDDVYKLLLFFAKK